MSSSGDACAALSDDIARAVHPDFRALDDHGADVKSTADAMLARLDELGAMLGTLRAEGREQREALEPVLEAFAEGLARDFAYVDSVEDTVAAIEAAVADTERQLASLEQSSFRRARLADVEAARRGIEDLFKRVGGVTANLSRTGGSIVGGFSDATRTAGNAVKHATEKAQVSATGAVARARAKAAAVKAARADAAAEADAASYWDEAGDSPRVAAGAGSGSVVETLSENVSKVFGLGRKQEEEEEEDGVKGNIPTSAR